ncbi:MAG: hypothetical protein II992_03060 [Lachnospiraceae bacterium]|nr:hypothetical protein [Lachnospiraceae bacterium]MBQ3600167.1 hypothetical protein [Lachnospiraceae bacterium]MBQ6995541.1 hypothetical protein [Lachnospiraceae bacterium]
MSESRVTNVKRNAASSIFQNILNIFLAYISRVIFVQILDVRYLGINGLFSNIIAVLSLADLGMGTAMMYSLYKPIANHDNEKIAAYINFFKRIYISIACVISLIGIALIPFLRYIVKLEQPLEHLEIYYCLSLAEVVISYLFVYRTTLLSADQKNYILNKYSNIAKITIFCLRLIILFAFKNYFLYLLVAIIVNLGNNILMNHITVKMYPFLKTAKSDLERNEKTALWQNVKALFFYKLGSVLQGNVDNILISVFVGTIYVGYYSNYSMIITYIVSFVSIVFSSVKATLGNLMTSEENNEAKKLHIFNVMELINFWIITFCSVCFISLFQSFIELSYGKSYLIELPVVVLVVINFYTCNIRQTMWAFRETTGIFQQTKYITMVTTSINFILSLILGYFYGMFGIILATIIARLVYAWWKEPQILFKTQFKKSARIYYTRYIIRLCLCFFICFINYKLCVLLPINNLVFKFIVQVVICCIFPNLVLLLLYGRTEEFSYIVNTLFKSKLALVKKGKN